MKLVTVAEMRAIEQASDARGWTYEDMMEAAGTGLARLVANLYGDLLERSALGLVGAGNNGGDTLVALSWLAEHGWRVTAYLVKPRSGDPLVDRVRKAGGKVLDRAEDEEGQQLAEAIADHRVLLDGVLGTGVRLPLREPVASFLARARALVERHQPHVVAVDVPSGVDCDTGAVAEQAIPAEHTVTMAAAKMGMVQLPALAFLGQLHCVSIGTPPDLPEWQAVHREVVDADRVRALLPPRPADAHKGTFGTVMVVAGSMNFTGAALLAGRAAYRVGAGLVTLAVPAPLHTALAGHFPEATWVLLPHELGVISDAAVDVLRENLGRSRAMVVGPGFGLEDPTAAFVERFLGHPAKKGAGIGFLQTSEEPHREPLPWPPLVVDADGLKLLARVPEWFRLLPAPAVLTPHPGEMSVLTGLSRQEIQSDRLGVAEHFAREWGHVVVLKGAGTVIAAPDGRTAVVPVASSALARAGTGDVLAGTIAGLRAQGLAAYEAALAGAWLHAQAGLEAARQWGYTAPVLAGELVEALGDVQAQLMQNER